MSEMLKKPYKITLWEDRNKIIYDNQDNVQNEFLEEVCIATIGSNTMDSPIRAFNPILTEELNGSKTFTFTIYSRYWDDKDEEFKLNPFTNLLVNERKVKLFYNKNETFDGWYDFVIKQVQENSENYTYTYICKDLFVNELGKTGYSVELDTELENNMGTITYLADKILKGTDWQVGESDPIIQKNKESLYSYMIPDDTTISDVKYALDKTTPYNSGLPDTESGEIPEKQVILVFYSTKTDHEDPVQFLYNPQESSSNIDEALKNYYQIDEYGFVKDCVNLIVDVAILPEHWEDNLYPTDYFGEKLISKQATKFFPQIGETCKIYKKNEEQYYAYTELEYPSVAEIQSLISNGTGFLSANGWIADSGAVLLSFTSSNNIYQSALEFQGANYNIYNTGFYDNRAQLSPNGFIAGEKYVLMIKGTGFSNPHYLHLEGQNGNSNIPHFLTFDPWTPDNIIDSGLDLTGYNFYLADCNTTISYTNLLKNYGDLRLYLKHSDGAKLIDCKVFKYRLDNNNKLIIPDLEKIYYTPISNPTGNPKLQGWYEVYSGEYVKTNDETVQAGKTYYNNIPSVIKTRYYFFSDVPEQTVWTKQDLNIVQTFLEDETYVENQETKRYLDDYIPVMTENCEKITSITGSKSNRFNLIQSLCEAFECWAKFTIEHDEIGRTTYKYVAFPSSEYVEGGRYYTYIGEEAPEESSIDQDFQIYNGTTYPIGNVLYKKVYDKYVTFKEYIGDNNLIGFRYGINLKSIQRNIISDQIASKVIVQPNTNEFAPNGSCTIQQAFLNPTGENALYNFQYFVNQNLLDGVALNNDLYGYDGGIGFFPKMKEYNKKMRPYIDELTEISKTLYTLESRQAIYNAMYEENDRLKKETEEEIRAAGYENAGSNVPDYIKNLQDRLKTYQGTMTYYSPLIDRTNGLVDAYRDKYNIVTAELDEIRKQKDQLNHDFENKYYRFIQEGTWTSSDYWDPDLYYDAANMVLYTSSFPQISYTINVLELSQVEGYENYKFRIADKTYIEDTEFFGYDNKGRPYKEEIVISQVKSNLDDPSQNTITVQNYKTQFQDLFQRMAATSQSLQYHEGEYQRAASAINDDGTINSALMQNTLEANALIIQNAKNQSVTWDETGITISNFLNANEIVRLTSSGIALTKDGGRNWTTGLTGDGVNADVITAGRIDTDRIRIFNKAMQQTFEWNDKGINAYMWSNITNSSGTSLGTEGVNYGQFVRFDKYGLYGYKGGNPNWDPEEITLGAKGIDKVIRDSTFSLTWKGLHFNLSNGQGFSQVISPTGSPKDKKYYEYNSLTEKYFMSTDEEVDPSKTYYENNDTVINVNDKFKVDGAGNITATSGVFSGELRGATGTFEGTYSGELHIGPIGNTGYYHFNVYSDGSMDIRNSSSSASFSVSNSGTLNASGATFSGTLNATTLSGTLSASTSSGDNPKFGNWNFSDDAIYTTPTATWGTRGVYIGIDGISIVSTGNYVFKVSNTGWTKTNGIEVEDVKLYGDIQVYDPSTSGAEKGYIGYAEGDSSLASGVAMYTHRGNGFVYGGVLSALSTGAKLYYRDSSEITYGQCTATSNALLLGYRTNHLILDATSFYPNNGNLPTLGTNSKRWGKLYTDSNPDTSSDRRLKHDIEYNLDIYNSFFNDLLPVRYKLNCEKDERFHIGFIAQDVENALNKNKLLYSDFSGFSKNTDYYSLCYGDFIALNTYKIKQLEKRITVLENLTSSQNSYII